MSLKGNIADTQTLNGNAMMSDGFSPIVEVEKTEAGHKVIITDKYDKKEFSVLNGKDGEKGDTGEFPIDQVKRDFSPSIINSASGETVVTTDSAEVTPVGMTLFGKSTQNTVAGNQLLNLPNVDSVTLGNKITWSCKDGVVTAVGNTTSITNTGGYIYQHMPIVAGDYFVSGDGKYVKVLCKVTRKDGTVGYFNNRSFTLDGTETDVFVYVAIQNDGLNVDINETLYPMVNKGTNALPFEPYVGGEASPNLNYKQDVVPHGASGSIEQKFLNSNIYDTALFVTASSNGITRELVNGRIHFYGTATTSGNFRFISPNTIRYGKSGKVTLSVQNISGTFGKVYVSKHKDDVWETIGELNKDNGYKAVFELGDYDIIPYAIYENGVTYDTYLDFVINYGEQPLPYEPYSEQVLVHQTPNGLHGIPLGATIPDVIKNSPIHMSGVYWDNATSQYYLGNTKNENGQDVQRVKKIIPNKTLVFGSRNDAGRCSVFIPNYFENTHFLGGSIFAYSNIARFSSWVGGADGTFCINGDNIYYKDSTKTLEEVNAKFSELGTDVEFVGVLAEPIVTDLTEEELAQYNEVHMNYPNTTIVNSDSAYTEVEYVADTKKYVDNKFKELEANITSAVAQLL